MHCAGIEGIGAVTDTEKSGRLLECFRPHPGDFCELGAGPKGAVLIAMMNGINKTYFAGQTMVTCVAPAFPTRMSWTSSVTLSSGTSAVSAVSSAPGRKLANPARRLAQSPPRRPRDRAFLPLRL